MQVTLEYNDPLDADTAVTGRLPAAIAAGIRYAVAHGATVISLPLDPGTMGGRPDRRDRRQPGRAGGGRVRHLPGRPAGGPGGRQRRRGSAVNYPAAYPGVIAVGATARDGELAPFTNTGSYVALTAPGAAGPAVATGLRRAAAAAPVGLTVAAPGGGYQTLASTDMASALTRRRRRAHPRSLPVAHGGRGHPGDRGRRDRARRRPGGLGRDQSRRRRVGPRRAQRRERAGPGRRDRGRSPATRAVAAGVDVGPDCPAGRPSAGAARPPPPSSPATPGGALRSVLRRRAAAVCVLIAGLVCALTVTWVRRRRRSARADDAARDGRGREPRPSLARPAAGQAGPAAAARSGLAPHPAAGRHRRGQRLGERQPERPAVARAGRLTRRWPPWEQSPSVFASAPAPKAPPPWPLSSTGPMYVWNPAATTGPSARSARSKKKDQEP